MLQDHLKSAGIENFTPVISSSSHTITDDKKMYNALSASQIIGKSKEMKADVMKKRALPPIDEVTEANYEILN